MNIFQRLAEPSTHAGIAVAAQGLSVFFPQYASMFAAFTIIFGGTAMAMPEKSGT